MRLRATLTLAFAALLVLQLAAVGPIALRNLSQLLERQHHSRVKQLMVTAQGTRDRFEHDALHALDELAESDELKDLDASVSLTSKASSLMTPRGLQVLSLFDLKGKTLSSGHHPARLGELDSALFGTTATPGKVLAVKVDFSTPEGLVSAPALVAARQVSIDGGTLWLVGGFRLDARFADELARLTGARVEISSDGATPIRAGSAEAPFTREKLSFVPAAEVTLSFSRADLLATRDEVLRAFLGLAGLGFALALIAGIWISRRITRPVEALTEAARQIGEGAPGVTVDEQGSREVKALVQTFNRMTGDLKSATDKLVASERVAAWQEVARRLAHEIKNPLTPIRMSLENLVIAAERNNPHFQKLVKDNAVVVLEEVERLKRIVDEFSSFARLPRAQRSPISLSELATALLSLYAPHGGIDYRAEIAPNVMVSADRDQLTQVLVNLLKNAEEAMAGKGGLITVRVLDGTAEKTAALEVEDQGPGIPPELKDRLFEPYVTTKASGTGLGLAIAARIAQEHDGRLTVDSPPGQGARFRLSLPSLPRVSDR